MQQPHRIKSPVGMRRELVAVARHSSVITRGSFGNGEEAFTDNHSSRYSTAELLNLVMNVAKESIA
jgi:hypothetical protein